MYDVDAIRAEPLLLSPLARSVHQGAPPTYVRSAKIKITARCNLRCSMCRYGTGMSPPELGTERMLAIVSELADFGCRKIHFSGGEVFTRSDFVQLVAAARARSMKVTLTSNLTLLTKDRAKALMHARPSAISTSLDGASAKVHDSIRGIEGSFKRTLRGLDRLATLRAQGKGDPKLRINFVMMRSNFRDYPRIIEIAARYGAVDVVPMPVDTTDERTRLSKRLIRIYNDEIAPEAAELRARSNMPMTARRIHPFGVRSSEVAESARGRYSGGFYERRPCLVPFLHMFIGWDGKVYPCCMTNGRMAPLGDLSHQSVTQVFEGPAYQRLRRHMLTDRLAACHACDMVLDENRKLLGSLEGSSTVVRRTTHLPVV